MTSTDELLTTLIEYTKTCRSRDTLYKAVDRIPEFDGETPPLGHVLRKISDGLTLISPEEEKDYVSQVITRLTGAARISVEGKNFRTVEDLQRHLKKRYAPGRDPASFLAELGRLQIQERERLASYIGRTSEIVNKARASIKSAYVNSAENVAQMEKTALENFIRGLPDQIYYTIAPKSPATLDAAYDLVIEEDRARRNRRQALGHYRDQDRDDSPVRPMREHQSRYLGRRDNIVTTTSDDTTTSSGTDARRHSRRRDFSPATIARVFSAGLRSLNLNASRSPSRDRSDSGQRREYSSDRNEDPFCTYCKRRGHVIELCWTLEQKQREAQEQRRRVRANDRGPDTTRDSSASAHGSLNYEGGRHDEDPPRWERSVRFTERETKDSLPERAPTAILRRPPLQESRSEPQNWRQAKENSQ